MMQSFYDELETVIDHEYKVNSKGRVTKFRRTNKESEEVARKFTIMRKLQLKFENMTSTRQAIPNLFQSTCENLTSIFKATRSSCLQQACDLSTPYRSIDACCNNLAQPSLGINTW